MQRRFSTIFILSLLLLAFGAMTAFAANAPVQKRVVDLKVDKSVYYSFPNEYNFQAGTSSDRPLRSSTYGNSASAVSPGTNVGDTWYDYQHNGTMGRMIAWGPYTIDGNGVVIHDAGSASDPGLHFSWMGLPGPVMASRAYYYNYYNAATGLFSSTGPIPVQPTDEYAGYVGVDVTPDNKGVVGGHNNQGSGYQSHFYWDFDAMFGFFSANKRVEDTVAEYAGPTPNAVIWPKFGYQVGTQTVTHVIAQVSAAAAADPQAIYYFRKVGSEDAGNWDYPPYVIDTIYDLSHDIACEPMGDKVALVWTGNLDYSGDPCNGGDTCSGESDIHVQWDNDIYYQISNNQGSTWQPRVNLTKNVNGEAGFRPYTDLSSLIDSDANLHIVWSGVVWPADALADGWGWNCRVFHWSEDNPFIRTVHSADFTQTTCTPGAWNINASKMQVSECDGKIYVLWVQYNDPETHLDDCHTRAAGGTGDVNGSANGELYFAISGDNGLTWDKARNLTNSYTPLCNPEGGGIDCENDNWPSMAKYGRQDQVGENWTGAVYVDPSPGQTYAGDMYLDVQYVHDKDAGGIVQNEGTWQLSNMAWFRMACVEPIPNPLPVISPAQIDEPIWTKPSVQRNENIVIENAGNVALVYSVILHEFNGTSGWLATSGLSGNVPSGLSNVETGTVHLNNGGVQTTEAILLGRIVIDHNGPTDSTVIPVRLLVADTLVSTQYDTLFTACLALAVGTNGSFGQAGAGQVNLDWVYSDADCDTTQEVYLYDGAPVILWEAAWDSIAGTDTVYHSSIFQTSYLTNTKGKANGVNGFRPIVSDRCVKNDANLNRIVSGQFVTQDSTIAMQKFWYGSTHNDSCDFVIQCLKLWSNDGAAHSGLRIGEAVDWDVPSDSGAENKSGFDFTRNLIYQYGAEYHQDDTGANAACQDSDVRFAGMAFIESFLNGAAHQSAPYSAYTHENDTMVFPTGNFRPGELWRNMDVSGFNVSDSTEDLHTVMCFEPNYSLGANDTLEFYVIYATVLDGGAAASPAALQAVIDKANAWYNANAPFDKSCGCCVGATGDVNGSGAVDISDLLFLVDYQFTPGSPAPPCIEEADVNCSGAVDISDLLFLVDYQFTPGSPAPCACP